MRLLSLVAIIYRSGIAMLLDAQATYALLAQLRSIGSAVRHMQHPFVQPGLKAIQHACALVILMVKLVIALGVTLYGGRMRPPGLVYYCPHFERWPQHTVGIAHNNFTRHNLLSYQDHSARCKHGLFAQADVAPDVGIPFLVAALHMDNGYIRMNSGHKQQW